MTKPKIILHLGAHKTATTYIQSRLYNSIKILKDYDIGYIPLVETRKLITSKLNQHEFPKEEIIESLRPYMKCERLILSDENFLGGTSHPYNNKIYGKAEQRVRNILRLFDGYEIETHITLRNYVDYFISRYAESLRHFRFLDFDSYYEKIDFDMFYWGNTIEQIKKSGINNIKISVYENIFNNEQTYFDALIGKSGIALERANDDFETRRAKFTEQGYEVVKFYAENFSTESTRKIMKIIDNNHQETQSTVFMPFKPEHQQKLLSQYELEIDSMDIIFKTTG